MKKFICDNCNLIFESRAVEKYEYMDPVFGSCWNYTAICPECKNKCSEKIVKKHALKSNSLSSFYTQNSCDKNGCCPVVY